MRFTPGDRHSCLCAKRDCYLALHCVRLELQLHRLATPAVEGLACNRKVCPAREPARVHFFTGLPASSRDPEKNAIPATWKPSAVAGQRQHCEPPHFIFTFAQHCCYFCLMSHSHLICGSLSSCTNIGAKSRSLTLLRMPHSHHTIPAWQILEPMSRSSTGSTRSSEVAVWYLSPMSQMSRKTWRSKYGRCIGEPGWEAHQMDK